MIGMTMCSGIGAPELAAPWIDWRFASEIEEFPRQVLQKRFGYVAPEDHNQGDPLLWGDMTEINPDLLRQRGIPLPDLIVAGTPCQAFSIAGLRKGTDDERGNLTLKFVEICHDIAAARPDGKLCVVWENVPGVLSDKNNAFGCFLGGLVGAVDALPQPEGGTWPGEGMVEGPRARVAWAVLDAQWFGVAQRRRRVFAVIDFGNCIDPAAVLLEPDSMRGNTPPSREAGENVAGTISARPTGGGGLGTDFDCDGGLIPTWPADVAPTLNAAFGDKMGLEDQHALAGGGSSFPPDVANTLTQRMHKGANTTLDEGQTLIPSSGGVFDEGPDVVGTICGDSFTGGASGRPEGAAAGHFVPVAFDCKGTEVQYCDDDTHPTLRSMSRSGSHQNAGGHAAIAEPFTLMERGRNGTQSLEYRRDGTANALLTPNGGRGGMGVGAIATPWAVRRLTPRECERLQGMPDDHTLISWKGKPADQCPDGHRYKAIGNSMAVPVMRWILDRVKISFELEGKAA